MRTNKAIKSTLVVLFVLVVVALAAHPDTVSFEAQAGSTVFHAYPIGTPTSLPVTLNL